MKIKSTASETSPVISWLSAPHWLFGPLITATTAVLIELLEHHGISVAAPPAVLVLCIAYTATTSGVRAGLLSAAVAWLAIAHYYSVPGEPFHYTDRHLIYILLWAVTAPAMAVIIGYLGRRAGLATTLERAIAERERAESAARESEEKFRQLAENIRDVFWVTDAELKQIHYVSPAYEEVWGRSCESVYRDPTSWLEAIHPEDRERVLEALPSVSQGRYSDEYRVVRPDGSIRWVSDRAYPVRDHAGRVVRVVGIAADVTERRRAEEELRLLQSITIAVGEAPDLNAALEVVLRKVCAATGWAYGEAWLPCEENEKLQCGKVFYARETGLDEFALRSRDFRFERGEGLPGRVWASRRPVWIPDVTEDRSFPRAALAAKVGLRAGMGIPVLSAEEVVAVIAFFVRRSRSEDERLVQVVSGVAAQLGQVIRRKHAEETLRSREAQLRAVFEAEPECVKLVGTDGTVLQMNATGLAMFEADKPSQVIGHRVYQLVLPEYRDAYRAFHDSIIRGNRGSLEFEIVGLKGTRRWLETHAVPMADSRGQTVMLGIARDITERKKTEARLSYMAHYDTLTGLANRTLFNDRLQQAMIDANRHERLVGVMFLDLDRFKNINDSLGHETGDTLLKSVAERLLGAVRRGDTVARLSGDEFAFVLADVGHVDGVAWVAQKILDVFEHPFHVNGRELFVTGSLGITLYPFDDKDVQGLLRNADVAMYRAKEAGRNNFQFYTAEMTTTTSEFLALENDLRHAVEHRELFLEYQPVINCRNGEIIGVEALLRWRHPRRGLIAPVQFIPMAEETGLIISIGEWVLRTACAQVSAWLKGGVPALRLAVNLSARQFQQARLETVVEKILHETGLPASALELEITETVIMQHAETTIGILKRLSATGVTFAIDDFGTGYSSLSYLKRFPIDAVKIDRSFVRDIPGDPDDMAIAKAILTMAHSLGIRVIAEGVENREQFGFLRDQGCDAIQGYYFSRPVSTEQITLLLRAGKHFDVNG